MVATQRYPFGYPSACALGVSSGFVVSCNIQPCKFILAVSRCDTGRMGPLILSLVVVTFIAAISKMGLAMSSCLECIANSYC